MRHTIWLPHCSCRAERVLTALLAVVPAGRFDGCFRARTEGQWGPWKSVADSWRHPAVPVSGLVRSQGLDHPFTMDLVAFGMTGATADF